jgi:hypothetical protein
MEILKVTDKKSFYSYSGPLSLFTHGIGSGLLFKNNTDMEPGLN